MEDLGKRTRRYGGVLVEYYVCKACVRNDTANATIRKKIEQGKLPRDRQRQLNQPLFAITFDCPSQFPHENVFREPAPTLGEELWCHRCEDYRPVGHVRRK